jgi:hypothetical protein
VDLRRACDATAEGALVLGRAVGGVSTPSGIERFALEVPGIARVAVEGAQARLDVETLEPERIILEAAA